MKACLFDTKCIIFCTMLYSFSYDLSSYSKISSVTSYQPSMLGNSLYTMAEQK